MTPTDEALIAALLDKSARGPVDQKAAYTTIDKRWLEQAADRIAELVKERDEAIRTLKNSTVLMGSYLDRARKAASCETRLGNLRKERDEWERYARDANKFMARLMDALEKRLEEHPEFQISEHLRREQFDRANAAEARVEKLRAALTRIEREEYGGFAPDLIAHDALEADKPTDDPS